MNTALSKLAIFYMIDQSKIFCNAGQGNKIFETNMHKNSKVMEPIINIKLSAVLRPINAVCLSFKLAKSSGVKVISLIIH